MEEKTIETAKIKKKNIIKDFFYLALEKVKAFFLRYTVPIFAVLFALGAYIILTHIDNQQSNLINSIITQVEHVQAKSGLPKNTALIATHQSFQKTLIILVSLFCIFLIVLAYVIQKLKTSIAKEKEYIDQMEQINSQLNKEVDERKKLADELLVINRKQFKIAFYDGLTGLPNRQLYEDRLKKQMEAAERTKSKLALFFLDLDGFKHVNDTLGHDAGDELLKIIAERLTSCVRKIDTVSRQGGDEFTLILAQLLDAEDSSRVAKKILQRVAEPIKLKDVEVFVTASIGISVFPDDGLDVETLAKNADLAMYKAKDSGRNNFQFFSKDLQEKADKQMALVNDLHAALKKDEFIVYYQPQLDVSENKIIGVEALARWGHPKFGVVGPDDFISMAENAGLIGELGDKIFEKACEDFSSWQNVAKNHLNLAVNISALQLRDKNMLEKIVGILAKHKIQPSSLELEITESVIMRQTEELQENLRSFTEYGIKIVVDDFGTGYSGLSYLDKFHTDMIKIDKSFIRNLIESEKSENIVISVLDLAKKMQVQVLAEGVETEAQKDKLLKLGCKYMQGYLFGKPVTAEKIVEMLGEENE